MTAVAAGEWAKRTDGLLLQAYAADVAARAYAADGQADKCFAALDAARNGVIMAGDQQPGCLGTREPWQPATARRGWSENCAKPVPRSNPGSTPPPFRLSMSG